MIIAQLEKEWGCKLTLGQAEFVRAVIALPSFNNFSSIGSGKSFCLAFIEELMRRNRSAKRLENPHLLNVESTYRK